MTLTRMYICCTKILLFTGEVRTYANKTITLPAGETCLVEKLDNVFFTDQTVLLKLLPSPDMMIVGYEEVVMSVTDDGG